MTKTEAWYAQGTPCEPKKGPEDLSDLLLQQQQFYVRCAVDEQTGRLLGKGQAANPPVGQC